MTHTEETLQRLTGREAHPTLPMCPPEMAAVMGEAWTAKFYELRRQSMIQEAVEPLLYGYEPPVWKLADFHRAELRRITPKGVIHEVNLGGNRASKTERAAKRIMQFLIQNPGSRAWCCDSTEAQSRVNQMRLLWKYFPAEWRNEETGKLKSNKTTKVRYSVAGGFTENIFVLPNGSECAFKFYGMSVDDLEGPELDIIWADELVPHDWIETLIYRLITRNGIMHVTFTPKTGYTQTVARYLDDAVTIDEVEAELLPIRKPKDSDTEEFMRSRFSRSYDELPDASKIAISRELWEEGRKKYLSGGVVIAENPRQRGEHHDRPISPTAPAAQNNLPNRQNPDDRSTASEGKTASMSDMRLGANFRGDTAPRLQHEELEIVGYEKVPRVQLCKDPKARVIYFHTADNPYGNYEAMKEEVKGKPKTTVLMRAYGVATKAANAQFPLFKRAVHVISMNRLAQMGMDCRAFVSNAGDGRAASGTDALQFNGRGSRYQLIDPCSGRNWFMLWVWFPMPGKMVVYREWPSYGHDAAYIPGIGDPGPWMVASTGKRQDGDQGPAQASFGFGLERYKAEIERVEAGEKIDTRLIDSRYSNARKTEREGETTLIEQLAEIGLDFVAMAAEKNILNAQDGSIDMINSALYYDVDTEVGKFSAALGRLNEPNLLIAENCPNTIDALEKWTGRDGQHGACKDPIDCLRGAFLSEIDYVDEQMMKPRQPWLEAMRR